MRSDYSIKCDDNPTYSAFLLVAVVNTVLYPIGIPFFFYILIRAREKPWSVIPSSPLYYNFSKLWAYFEVFELFRKLLLTSVVSFVLPGSASQCLFLLVVDILALLILSICRPYLSESDDFLSGTLILVECTIFLIAFLILSEVYETDNYDRGGMMDFAFALVLFALCGFVLLNVISKIPALEAKYQKVTAQLNVFIMDLGIKLPSLKGLDARSRYTMENQDLRHSMTELQGNIIFKKDESCDVELRESAESQRKRKDSET